jgi:hypothetical protein
MKIADCYVAYSRCPQSEDDKDKHIHRFHALVWRADRDLNEDGVPNRGPRVNAIVYLTDELLDDAGDSFAALSALINERVQVDLDIAESGDPEYYDVQARMTEQ